MKTKTVCLYDPATGEFTGTYSAQESPLDTGSFIAPTHSTEIDPPAPVHNKSAVFSAGAWALVDDFRGQTFYDQITGAAIEITALGQPGTNLGAAPPPRTLDERVADFTAAVSAHLDTTVRARGYDSMLSCASYATSANAAFKAEALAAIAWRDAVWTYCYAELVKVQAGARLIPVSEAAFIAELPILIW